MKLIFALGYILVLLMLSSSCEQVIDAELPEHESKIVINASLEAGVQPIIFVSRSVGILSNEQPEERILDNARVRLWQNGVEWETLTFYDTLIRDSAAGRQYQLGFYTGTSIPQIGKQYQLGVEHPDFEAVQSQTTIPVTPAFQSLRYLAPADTNEAGDSLARLSLILPDPGEQANYYHLFARVVFSDSLDPFVIHSKNWEFSSFEGLSQKSYEGGMLLPDDLFNGQEPTLNFLGALPAPPNQAMLTSDEILAVAVELRHCSEAYFAYQVRFPEHELSQQQGQGFFFPDPISGFSNVQNGYGIFASYTALRDTIWF